MLKNIDIKTINTPKAYVALRTFDTNNLKDIITSDVTSKLSNQNKK